MLPVDWAMILKAKERGDAMPLVRYLLATRDNDHVEQHRIKSSTTASPSRRPPG
jgi:hypothetical protein